MSTLNCVIAKSKVSVLKPDTDSKDFNSHTHYPPDMMSDEQAKTQFFVVSWNKNWEVLVGRWTDGSDFLCL